jgi:hypothetical protein
MNNDLAKNSLVLKCLITIGVILLLSSFFVGYNRINFLNNSSKTLGYVSGYSQTNGYSAGKPQIPRTFYYPLVSFNSSDGRTFQFKSSVASNVKSYTLGDSVEVVYSKDNPSNAEIYSVFRLWALTGGLFFLGLILVTVGYGNLKHPERIIMRR